MFVVVRHDIVVIRRWGVVWASPGGNFSIGGGRQGPAPAPSVVVHSSHPRQKTGVCSQPLDNQHRRQGWRRWRRGRRTTGTRRRRTRCQRSPTSQQVKTHIRLAWQEYLCLYVFVPREAARASKEASRRSEAKVCPNWSPAGKEAWSEEQQMIRSQFHPC